MVILIGEAYAGANRAREVRIHKAVMFDFIGRTEPRLLYRSAGKRSRHCTSSYSQMIDDVDRRRGRDYE